MSWRDIEDGSDLENEWGMWFSAIHYDKLEILGEGGQGQVFKALRRDRRTQLCHLVALKVLHSKTAVELWRREFESLRKVKSRGCVQVLAFDRVGGRPALVLEYVDGTSLANLARDPIFSYGEVDEILAQIERALRDLKAAGLFHGDLTPANVLIDRRGQIKLLDFGLANLGGPHPRLTPEFAAPERLTGSQPNFAADLYSLGKIEIFLRKNAVTVNAAENYLAQDPYLRRPRGLAPDSTLQAILGAKVEAYLLRASMENQKSTRTWPGPSGKKSRKSHSSLILAASLTVLSLQSSTASSARRPHPWITIAIRTLKWHRVAVNGVDLGFAPVSYSFPAGSRLEIAYQSSDGVGRKVLHPQAGQRIVLDDSDFKKGWGPREYSGRANSNSRNLGR